MAFKFPVLKPMTIDCSRLPVHDFKCLTNKEIIGKGANGAVFTANWVVSSCTGIQRNETLTNCVTTPCMDMKTIGIPPCTGTPGHQDSPANWQTVPDAGGKSAAAENVVVKKLLGDDILDKKTFVKEARIIQELKHPNIVKFKGICNNPFALILEFPPAECK